MKTIEEKAGELYRSLDVESAGVFRGEIISLIIKALKEQDRDTRHACAEAILSLPWWIPNTKDSDFDCVIERDEAHKIIINTKVE